MVSQMLGLLPATAITDEITAFGAICVPMTLGILWVLSAMMDKKLQKLLQDINGTYLKKEIADLKYVQIEHSFDHMCDGRKDQIKRQRPA